MELKLLWGHIKVHTIQSITSQKKFCQQCQTALISDSTFMISQCDKLSYHAKQTFQKTCVKNFNPHQVSFVVLIKQLFINKKG
jgi:hypothetical protein